VQNLCDKFNEDIGIHYSITATEMIFARNVEGKMCTERIRNHKIRGDLKINMLEDELINDRITWRGHVLRMTE